MTKIVGDAFFALPAYTTPQEDVGVELSDYGNALQISGTTAASAVNRLGEYVSRQVGAEDAADFFEGGGRYWDKITQEQQAQYSDAAKEALAKRFDTLGSESAFWDLNSLGLNAMQSAIPTIGMLGPLGVAVRAGITSPAALASIGALTEGSMAAGYISSDIAQSIEGLTTEQLDTIPGVKELKAAGKSEEWIKDALKKKQQSATVPLGAIGSAATGAIAGPIMGKLLSKASKLGVTGRIGEGLLTEGTQEAAQEGIEQVAGNIGAGRYPTEDLVNAMGAGFATGGPMGGAAAGVFGRRGAIPDKQGDVPDQEESISTIATVMSNPDVTPEDLQTIRTGMEQTFGEDYTNQVFATAEERVKADAKRSVVPEDVEQALKESERVPAQDTAIPETPVQEPTLAERNQKIIDQEFGGTAPETVKVSEPSTDQTTIPDVEAARQKEAPVTNTPVQQITEDLAPEQLAKYDKNYSEEVPVGKKGKTRKRKVYKNIKQRAGAFGATVQNVWDNIKQLGYTEEQLKPVTDLISNGWPSVLKSDVSIADFYQKKAEDRKFSNKALDNIISELPKAVETLLQQEPPGIIEPAKTESPKEAITRQVKELVNEERKFVEIPTGTRLPKGLVPDGFKIYPVKGKGRVIVKTDDKATLKEVRQKAAENKPAKKQVKKKAKKETKKVEKKEPKQEAKKPAKKEEKKAPKKRAEKEVKNYADYANSILAILADGNPVGPKATAKIKDALGLKGPMRTRVTGRQIKEILVDIIKKDKAGIESEKALSKAAKEAKKALEKVYAEQSKVGKITSRATEAKKRGESFGRGKAAAAKKTEAVGEYVSEARTKVVGLLAEDKVEELDKKIEKAVEEHADELTLGKWLLDEQGLKDSTEGVAAVTALLEGISDGRAMLDSLRAHDDPVSATKEGARLEQLEEVAKLFEDVTSKLELNKDSLSAVLELTVSNDDAQAEKALIALRSELNNQEYPEAKIEELSEAITKLRELTDHEIEEVNPYLAEDGIGSETQAMEGMSTQEVIERLQERDLYSTTEQIQQKERRKKALEWMQKNEPELLKQYRKHTDSVVLNDYLDIVYDEQFGDGTQEDVLDSDTEQLLDDINYDENDYELNQWSLRSQRSRISAKYLDEAVKTSTQRKIIASRVHAGRILAKMLSSTYKGGFAYNLNEIALMARTLLHKKDPLYNLMPYIFGSINPAATVRAVKFRKLSDSGANETAEIFGQYIPKNDRILISNKLAKIASGNIDTKENVYAAEGIVTTLFHEMLHAATYRSLTVSNKDAIALEAIRQKIIDKLYDEGFKVEEIHELQDVDEFVVAALESYPMQQLLAKHSALQLGILPKGSGIKTIWDQFVRLVGRMLNIPVKKDSALEAVMTYIPGVLNKAGGKARFEGSTNIRNIVEPHTWYEGDFKDIMDNVLLDAQSYMLPEDNAIFSKRSEYSDTLLRLAGSSAGGGAVELNNFAPFSVKKTINKAISSLLNGVDAVKSKALGLMMLDQLEDAFTDLVGRVKTNIELSGHGISSSIKNPLTAVIEAMRDRQTTARQFEHKYTDALTRFQELKADMPKEAQKMEELMVKSTMAGVYIHVPWEHELNKPMREATKNKQILKNRHDELSKEFNKLPKRAQDVYIEQFSAYKHIQAFMRDKLIRNYLHGAGIDDPMTVAAFITAETQQERKTFATKKEANDYVAKITEDEADKNTYGRVQKVDDGYDAIIYRDDLDSIERPETISEPKKPLSEMTDAEREKYDRQQEYIWRGLKDQVKTLNKLTKDTGPYFPLMRYGEYSFEATKVTEEPAPSRKAAYERRTEILSEPDMEGAIVKVTGNSDTGYKVVTTEYAFIKAETRSEAEEMAQQLEDEGFEVTQVSKDAKFDNSPSGYMRNLVSMAKGKLKDNPEALSALRHSLAMMAPETSIQKRLMRRKGITGASTNMDRAFANYITSSSWALANLDYAEDIGMSLNALRVISKTAARQGGFDSGELDLLADIATELEARANMAGKPVGKFAEYAAKLGFFNYLFTASYSVVNMTQPYLLTLPYLSGPYGAGAAAREVGSAYKLVSGNIARQAWANKFGFKAYTGVIDTDSMIVKLRDTIRESGADDAYELDEMLGYLAGKDILGGTFALEISEAAKGKGTKGPISSLAQKTMEMGRTMPHIIEIMNRSVTAIATYRLHMAAAKKRNPNMTKDQLIEEKKKATAAADKAIHKTQFDYSELNRPRYFMKNDLLRIMTMFKIHPLGVYGFMIGAIKGIKNKGLRSEYGKALGMLLMTHASLAGAAGALLWEPIKVAMAVLAAALGDEDEDEWARYMANPEIAMRKFVYEMTGSAAASEAVTFGAPRLLGFDMYTRLGIHSLMVRISQGNTELGTVINTATDSMLGPILGASKNYQMAAEAIANGQGWAKGMSYAAPKQIRDILSAYKYSKEGMTDFNGNVIADTSTLSAKDLAIKVFGFTPSKEAEIKLGRRTKQRRTGRLKRKIRGLVNRWKNASGAERTRIWNEDIAAFNNSLSFEERPAYRITYARLIKSARAQQRRERQTYKGAYYTRKERRMLEKLDWLNVEG